MVAKKILSIIIILLAIGGYYVTDDISIEDLFPENSITAAAIYDSGDMQVIFCPHQGCEGRLTSFLQSAEKSIDCALFEVKLESVKETLLEKSTQIPVRVVTDNDYLHHFNHSFVKADTWGLMHNKFCIVDETSVSTGSMNPTPNGAHKNDNNLLIIHSAHITQNYQDEFNEMYNGTFKKGKQVSSPTIQLNNKTIQTYFCPEDGCAQKVKNELDNAQSSIYFMTFSFTSETIANSLLLRHVENVEVKGVMEARQVTKYSQFERLKHNEVEVYKDATKQNMHHKVFIIDNKTVVTGSFNPTNGGNKRNDENVIIIKDETIAEQFLKEFNRLFLEAKQKAISS